MSISSVRLSVLPYITSVIAAAQLLINFDSTGRSLTMFGHGTTDTCLHTLLRITIRIEREHVLVICSAPIQDRSGTIIANDFSYTLINDTGTLDRIDTIAVVEADQDEDQLNGHHSQQYALMILLITCGVKKQTD